MSTHAIQAPALLQFPPTHGRKDCMLRLSDEHSDASMTAHSNASQGTETREKSASNAWYTARPPTRRCTCAPFMTGRLCSFGGTCCCCCCVCNPCGTQGKSVTIRIVQYIFARHLLHFPDDRRPQGNGKSLRLADDRVVPGATTVGF